MVAVGEGSVSGESVVVEMTEVAASADLLFST